MSFGGCLGTGGWGVLVGEGGEGLLVVILPGSRRSPSDVIVPYLLVLVMPGSLSGAQGPGHPHLPLVAERRPVGADRPAAAGTGQQRRQGQKTREVAPPPGAGRRLLRRTRRYPLARAPGRLPAGWAPSTASSCASAAPGVEAGARRPARAGKSGPRARPRPHRPRSQAPSPYRDHTPSPAPAGATTPASGPTGASGTWLWTPTGWC